MSLLKFFSYLWLASAALTIPGCAQSGKNESASSNPVMIDVWYGDQQSFGALGGHPQRWINILGNASPIQSIASMQFTLNNGAPRPLSFHEDKQRLARPGDFNVEIARSELRVGKNQINIAAIDIHGQPHEHEVEVVYHENESFAWSRIDAAASNWKRFTT